MTKNEIQLAKTIASQIEQLGLTEQFTDSFKSGDTAATTELLEIASDTWVQKIEKIQTLCSTRVECKEALSLRVLQLA